ncbi:MAG: transporter [Pseudomonadota bacterium]
MTLKHALLCLVFAASLSVGQVLFKFSANAWNSNAAESRGFISSILTPSFVAAIAVYGLTTILWVYILRSVPLSKAYVFSFLGSSIVPLLATYFFNEPLSVKYYFGFAIMLGGVYLCIS